LGSGHQETAKKKLDQRSRCPAFQETKEPSEQKAGGRASSKKLTEIRRKAMIKIKSSKSARGGTESRDEKKKRRRKVREPGQEKMRGGGGRGKKM